MQVKSDSFWLHSLNRSWQNVVEKLDFAAVCKHFEGKMHCHNQKQLSAAEDVKDNLDAERMKKGLRLSSRLRKTEGIVSFHSRDLAMTNNL